MTLEIGNFISDLNAANPANTDLKSQGGDHLRLMKKVIKASFPKVAGAVSKTHLEIDAAHDQRVPVGGIIMWSGALVNIPAGWLLCNGLSGTPNLMGRFVIGAGSAYGVGATGGTATHTLSAANLPPHSHGVNIYTGGMTANNPHTHTDAGHAHAGGYFSGGQNTGSASAPAITPPLQDTGTGHANIQSADINHAHQVFGDTGNGPGSSTAVNNLPPYYALCFIQKAA